MLPKQSDTRFPIFRPLGRVTGFRSQCLSKWIVDRFLDSQVLTSRNVCVFFVVIEINTSDTDFGQPPKPEPEKINHINPPNSQGYPTCDLGPVMRFQRLQRGGGGDPQLRGGALRHHEQRASNETAR